MTPYRTPEDAFAAAQALAAAEDQPAVAGSIAAIRHALAAGDRIEALAMARTEVAALRADAKGWRVYTRRIQHGATLLEREGGL